MTLWCAITVGVDFTVELQRWLRMGNVVVLILCGCIAGITCAVLSLCVLILKDRRETWRRRSQLLYWCRSPQSQQGRGPHLSHTPMRRAKARCGGRRRWPTLRVNTLKHDPKVAGHCAYSCVIAAAGKRPTLHMIRDPIKRSQACPSGSPFVCQNTT